jgi:hypothetical protein
VSWYDDETSVILSGGPVRVQVDTEDPDFESAPVGFVWPAPMVGVKKFAVPDDRSDELRAMDETQAPILEDGLRLANRAFDTAFEALVRESEPLLWQDEGDQA